MPTAGTRRRFLFQTLGRTGGALVAGHLLPLLAEAAKRKQSLRVAVDRDFESLRPDISAGYSHHMLARLLYTTSLLWGTHQRPDGILTYDLNTFEPLLLSVYEVSEDRQRIEFTLRDHAQFANGDPLHAQALKEPCPWLLAPRPPDALRITP
jgi:ABC-type transport system substrate-binding protein